MVVAQVFGSEDGKPETQFFRIGDVHLMADGGYVVADEGELRISVFDAAGRFVRSFGRPGEGPGELRTLQRPIVLSGDTIVAWDSRLRRVTAFRSDGSVVSVRPWRLPGGKEGWVYPIGRWSSRWIAASLEYQTRGARGTVRDDSVTFSAVGFSSIGDSLFLSPIVRLLYLRTYYLRTSRGQVGRWPGSAGPPSARIPD
jgi:hypothetical protein